MSKLLRFLDEANDLPGVYAEVMAEIRAARGWNQRQKIRALATNLNVSLNRHPADEREVSRHLGELLKALEPPRSVLAGDAAAVEELIEEASMIGVNQDDEVLGAITRLQRLASVIEKCGSAPQLCLDCSGSGKASDIQRPYCPECGGSGVVEEPE